MTTQAPNAEQVRAAWDALAPGFDDFVSPLTITLGEDILDRLDVRPGTRFLDVAAGSGALAIPAARRGARAVAVDIAPTMIDRLTARADSEGLTNLQSLVMDGQSLEFADGSFDVCASLNGVSLFPDIDVGLAEVVRVTKPGGTVLIAAFGAMQRTEFVAFFMSALRTAVPGFTPLPMDPPPLPFQVSDPETLHAKLVRAGLTAVRAATATWESYFESAGHYWNAIMASNPLAGRLTEGLTSEQREGVRRVDGMLRERSGGAPGAVLRNEVTIGVGTTGG